MNPKSWKILRRRIDWITLKSEFAEKKTLRQMRQVAQLIREALAYPVEDAIEFEERGKLIVLDYGKVGIQVRVIEDSVQVQLRGAFFANDNDISGFEAARTILRKLNSYFEGHPFLVLRFDIATDFELHKGISELPHPEDEGLDFRFIAGVRYHSNTKRKESGWNFRNGNSDLTFYLKLLDVHRNKKNRNEEKEEYYEIYFENYKDTPEKVCRAELKLTTTAACLVATKALYSETMTEQKVIDCVMADWVNRHNVFVVSPEGKHKRYWEKEPFWAWLFTGEKLKPEEFLGIKKEEFGMRARELSLVHSIRRLSTYLSDKEVPQENAVKLLTDSLKTADHNKGDREDKRKKTKEWMASLVAKPSSSTDAPPDRAERPADSKSDVSDPPPSGGGGTDL